MTSPPGAGSPALTVEQARERVIQRAFDGLAGKLDVVDAVDALIAAVRLASPLSEPRTMTGNPSGAGDVEIEKLLKAPIGDAAETRYLLYETRAALRSTLAALAAVRASAPSAQTWQPIETAPESEAVLVWLPNYGHVSAHRTCNDWWARGRHEIVYPSHWMPFPAPPQGDTL